MKDNFYIFLDIDGVLNHVRWFKKCLLENLEKKGFHLFFCPANIENLNVLLNYYKSKNFKTQIILTSTWRLTDKDYETCKNMLIKYGLNYQDEFDRTDLKPRGIRGRQIKNYMYEHNINKNFVIIDDKTKYLKDYFFKKDLIVSSGLFAHGLTRENVENYIANQEKIDFFNIQY